MTCSPVPENSMLTSPSPELHMTTQTYESPTLQVVAFSFTLKLLLLEKLM